MQNTVIGPKGDAKINGAFCCTWCMLDIFHVKSWTRPSLTLSVFIFYGVGTFPTAKACWLSQQALQNKCVYVYVPFFIYFRERELHWLVPQMPTEGKVWSQEPATQSRSPRRKIWIQLGELSPTTIFQGVHEQEAGVRTGSWEVYSNMGHGDLV